MSFPPLLAQRRPSPPGDSRVRSLCGSCTKSSIITQSNWVTTLSLGCALQCRGGPDGGRRVRRTLGVCLLICVRACSHLKTSLCEREREGERERREGGRQRERRGGGREREKIQPLRKKKKERESLRSVSGLLPLQLSPSKQKAQISTQWPGAPHAGFPGNAA